jgi:hypothetical protein
MAKALGKAGVCDLSISQDSLTLNYISSETNKSIDKFTITK